MLAKLGRERGWAAAFAFLLGGLTFASTLTPISDGDIWWHLAAGREMLATGGWLRVDPFTLSAAGRPWPDLHWLFQLWAYGLHQLGGLTAIVVGKAAVVTTGALVLYAAALRHHGRLTPPAISSLPPLLAVCIGGAVFAARHLVLARPVVFTLLFLALFLWVLTSYASHGRARVLLWLPALQILWANSQGLFALGPAVIAAYAAGGALAPRLGWRELPQRGARTLVGVLGLVLLACLVTPYGLDGVTLPGRLLARLAPGEDNVFSNHIAENIPPFVLERSSPGQFWHLRWALALVGLSFLLARHRLHAGHTALVLGFAALGLIANRNVLLFYWLAAPVVALHAAPTLDHLLTRLFARLSPVSPRARAGLAIALAACPLATLAALVAVAQTHETPIAAPAPFRVPAGSVQHLAALPTSSAGRLFNADHHGGYLTWRLHPRFRPFIDTRLVLHTADEYSDFLGLLDHPERWDEFARRQNFDHVILPSAFPDRYLGLIQHLYAAPDWRLVYTDGTEVLFSRAGAGVMPVDLGDAAAIAAILAGLDQSMPKDTSPGMAARRHLARLLLLIGQVPRAREVLDHLPQSDLDGQLLRVRMHLVQGELGPAEARATELLARTGEAPGPLDLLAYIALARGDTSAALNWLRRSLAVDPYGAEATALLNRLEAAAARQAAPATPTP